MVKSFLWWVAVFLCSLKPIVCEQFVPPQVWENVEYKRLIDVEHVYTIEAVELKVKNVDNKPNADYFFALPKRVFDNLSVFSVQLKDKHVFISSVLTSETTKLEDGTEIAYGLIQLPTPIEPDEDVTLNVNISYNLPNEPHPEHIGIADEQHLLLKTTRFPLSSYETGNGTVELFGSIEFDEFHAPEGHELQPTSGDAPGLIRSWEAIPPFAQGPELNVVYAHNIPMKRVVNLQRDVWLSHWAGSIQFEEYYELLNCGAKLNKGFSRLEHMLDQQNMRLSHYCSVLEMSLPEDSSDHYYTDKVGMVTTFRVLGDNIYLKPRYPIFGGWKYNFTTGWTNPLSNFLRQIEGSDRLHILSVPLLNGSPDTIYDNVDLSVYLPEGAKVDEVESPTPPIRVDISTQKSYLDLNKGHVKVTLTFKNMIDQVGTGELLIKYSYDNEALYRKPINVALYIFTALMGFFFLKSINLNVSN
ncbi:OST1 (YJL002C) [Zygosaccharomyces parabailii]|uniref:Dolichyl-diphosphooligosaccharide--protein glycosyltransferase subunit 1 n=1 Tax=Zygosaccharomyces bailii (strain CLIB 213 / ATCC 58445 / CBS 680 / BCRC 21525 / NBRC 1098 / NCYC 1416 / NRRL Y-2227) TaxID=1333698 RepID=A0A8J2T3U6_ZYGB2|nr:OST1 (YJL002C) [Zygosaccharomyces parabailii]CDF88370.1 BN860_08658g1_1 [Zygosaccharomyces bailii CLIB 213]CDH14748.1 related to Dolichyl-diphosphooligosaccharide--protein glycosyltransferase subunit 1 [Zygosaccharomyces bailii ISA1307]SJM81992.1 related to Dolichyl-diphosphooligosaccharide--protein glycosyltransferase subunit 1 [Zygosaccharomyces bailii]